jgi:two-component system chemotaxis response regulator CheB
MVTVLIVDDSAFMRRELSRIMESDPDIKVAGAARDGLEALDKVKSLNPDVVALDINMPKMDGLTALQRIMIESPRPCIMISSLTQEGAQETFDALDLGAVDYVPKPSGSVSVDIGKQREEIIAKVKGAAIARLPRRTPARVKVKKDLVLPEEKKRFIHPAGEPVISQKIVAIGVSTGGPKTLMDIVPKLPKDINAAVLIAQHMPGGFTTTFAKRMNDFSQIDVKEASESDIIETGNGYLAPGQYHMTVAKRGLAEGAIIRLSEEPVNALYRPSVDVMFNSVVKLYGSNTIGVLLTGMGSDGVDGMEKIKKAGGATIAEDESSCIIYGMPKGAIERGVVDHILPANRIAEKIAEILK